MEKLDEEQIADFKAAFSMFDKDGSGDVSTEELGAVLKELGQEVSKSQLEIMIKDVDADGSGSVEFPEFCSMMASLLGLGGANNDPFGGGGSVFKDLAKDMHTRIGQAKAMGIMPGSIDSAENLYRITAFIQKSQDHVGKSYQNTEKANALKARLGKRKKKTKRGARSVAQIRADRGRMSDMEQKKRDEDMARVEKMEEEREVASKLGARGRFGDGDGSYWDRWLQRGHVRMCDKDGVYSVSRNLGGDSSFSGGFKEPVSGFKRFEPDALLAASASKPIEERDQAARERRLGVSHSTLKHRQRHHAQFEMFRKGGIAAVARHFRESAAEAAARTGADAVAADADADGSSGSSADDESDDDEDEEEPDSGETREEEGNGSNQLLAAAGGATFDDDGNLIATRRRPNTEAEKQLAAEAADAALDEVAAPLSAQKGADADEEADAAEYKSLGKLMARENYFGEDARWNLFDAYKQLAADAAKELAPPTSADDAAAGSLRGGKLPPLPDRAAGADTAVEDGDVTDRATQMDHIGDARINFLSSCHQLGLAPEPLLVRRADVRSLGNAELRLRNRSLGPERIGALSRCMASMPLVKHLDLSGNRVQNGELPYQRAAPGVAVLGAGRAAARKAASDDVLIARTKGLEAGIGKNVGVGQDFVPAGTVGATTSQILSTSTITGRLALRSMTMEQFNDPDPEDEDAWDEERKRQIGADLPPSWVESRLKLPNMSQEGANWHTQVAGVAAVQAARSARKSRWQTGLALEEEKGDQAAEPQPDGSDGTGSEGGTGFQPQQRVSAWHDLIGSLRQQPGLLTLSLASNRLPFKHALALVSLIGDADGLRDLQSLDLSGCTLSDQVGKRLGLVVAKHEHLTKVLLDNNQLHAATGRAFREAISAKHNALVHLSMRNNNLSAVAVQELAEPLASNSMLQVLRLDSNNAGDDGACALASALIDAGNKSDVTNPKRMFRCSALRVLGLADNGIGARGCSALTLAMRDDGCGGPLQHLVLDGNPVGFGAALAMSVTVAELRPPRAGIINVSLARANVDLESMPLLLPDAEELPDDEVELDAEAQEEKEKAEARENNIRKIMQNAAGATDLGAETEATGAMRRPELRRGRDGSTGAWDVLAWPLRGPGNYTFELDNAVHLAALELVLDAVESAPGFRVDSCMLGGKQKLSFDSAPFELLGDDETVEGVTSIPESHIRAVAALDRARKTRAAEKRELDAKAEAEKARRIEAGEPPEDAPVDEEELTEEERDELRQRREEKEEAEKRRWGWLDASSSSSDVQHTVLRRPPELQRANLPDEGELELELAFDHSPVYDELMRPSPEQLKNGVKGCEAAESALQALCRRCANRFSGGGLLRVLTEGLRLNDDQVQRLEKAGEEADWWAERQRDKKMLELMGADASELDRQRYAKVDPAEVQRRAALLPDPKLLKKHDPTFNPLNRLTTPWYVLTDFAEVGASDAVPVAAPAARKAPEEVKWTLEKSVWGERPKQTKGGANPYHDYFDKPPFHCAQAKDARGRLFRTDWRRMAKKPNSKAMMDRNIGTSEDEVHEVRDEIARDYDWVCACFDFYCATGTGSAFSMSPNSFKDFLEDCNIPEKRSKFVSPELIDGMFVAVNVEVKDDKDAKAENAANDDRQLLRFEFLDILLRIAFAKYLQTGRTNDPSEAVDMLTERNIKANLDRAAMTHATRNEWRRERMYNEDVCEVLRLRKSSLKALFVKMSRANRKASAEPRMTIDEWCTICDRCGLLDAAFTKREARLAFVSSKFRVVDEVKHRLAWTSLSWYDFLELIPRAAEEKIYPTESQLRELIQTSETLVSLYKQLYKFDDAKDGGGTPEGTPEKEKSKKKAAKAQEREISQEELVRYCTIFDRWSGHDDFLDAEMRAQKDVDEQERVEADRVAKLSALERELDGTHMEEGGAGAGEAAALDAAEIPEDRRWPRQVKIADGVCTVTGDDQCLPLATKVQYFLNEIWHRFECDHDTIDPGEIEKDSNGVLGV